MRRRIILSALVLSFMFSVKGYCVEQKKEGLVKEYYDSGVLKSETNYKNGKKDGAEVIYDENGRMEYTSKYVKGEMVRSFASEPVRDLGPFKFLMNLRLWAGVIGGSVLLWLLFVKVVLKGKS